MRSVFRPKSHRAAKADESRSRRLRRHGLAFDALEGRQLLSLDPEFLVNETDVNDQTQPAIATAPNGRTVIAWNHEFSSTDGDIYAQIFASNVEGGVRVREIIVEGSSRDARDASVAMKADGSFVVTWTEEVNGQTDIKAKVFKANGDPINNNGAITVSDNSVTDEYDSDVALDNLGNFVVSYTRDFSATDQDIRARQFDANGNPLRASFPVAISGTFDELDSSVAMRPNGQFVVAYTRDNNGSAGDVLLKRYDNQGNLFTNGGEVVVANTSDDERDPDIAINSFGNAVVAYQRSTSSFIDVKAKRIDFVLGSTAPSPGSEINIANQFDAHQFDPVVAVHPTSGSFVVAYNFFSFAEGSRIEVAEVSGATNTVVERHTDFLTQDANPAISYDANGFYRLTYSGTNGIDTDIFARRGRRL